MSSRDKILLTVSVTSLLVMSTMLSYLWFSDIVVDTDNRRAVEQCTSEVRNGCPLLYDYLGLMERENAKLHKRIKRCETLCVNISCPIDDPGDVPFTAPDAGG